MVVGFGVDYGYASYINQRLARATDDATIGSVSQTAATAGGGYGNLAYLQSTGVSYFNANIAQLGITNVTFNLSVVSDGFNGVIANGNYNYNSPTFFGGLLGIKNIPLAGSAVTTARPLTYANYYILVDVSQSMGIGSTPADMTALYNRVVTNKNAASNDVGCVFGCHVYGRVDNGAMQKYTNEDLAHNLTQNWGPYITLRIDAAVSAITQIVTSASQIAGTTKNISFGLYTLNEDPTTGKRVTFLLDPPSNNYTTVQSTGSAITLGNTIGTSNSGNTDFHNEISDFLAGLRTATGKSTVLSQGSGASATSPLNYVFLITDGLNDVNGNCTPYGICGTPFDANDCVALKANATVGVIYTTYNPIYQFNTAPQLETRYANLVDGKPPLARTALQNCATSSQWFTEASDGNALIASLQVLFQQTQPVSARVTQ